MTGRQTLLPIAPKESHAISDFLLGESNAEAFARVLAPEGWASYGLRLIGPAGSGKTHLAAIFAQQVPQAAVIDDAPEMAEETLFHRLNAAKETGHPLLLTARNDWQPALPDLASRWRALPLATLGQPDEGLLRALLEKGFADRQLRVGPDILDYLIPRMERSPEAARKLVMALDMRALSRNSRVTVKMAREVLEE